MEGLKIISLGLGVQSTALYYMSSIGELPRADFAIMADTGGEKEHTKEYLKYLIDWQHKYDGIPIIVKSDKNLSTDLLNATNSTGQRFASIPAYVQNNDGSVGMLRRQCTSEYKIGPVNDAIRDLYGLRPGSRRPVTEVWKGITLDELERMSNPDSAWKIHVYPFTGFYFQKRTWGKIDWAIPFNRSDLFSWYKQHGLPIPGKSACSFCPYHSDAMWARAKKENPADFALAVKMDYAIRDSAMKGIKRPCFLHKSLKPLDEVVFEEKNDLWAGECSGTCHI